MIRISASLIVGFLLLVLQALIVMKINGYSAIQFSSPVGTLTIWLLNASFTFAVLTQLKPWFVKRLGLEANSGFE